MQQKGDVGITAEEILQKKPRILARAEQLTIKELVKRLQQIAVTSGPGSQESKNNILISLLQKTSATGAKYITKIVLGTLRLGVGDMTILDALAMAFTGDKKNRTFLERAYNICPDVGIIAETIVHKGIKGLEKMEIHLGRPIKMMLAQRVEQWEDISKKMPGRLAVEGKYDGERIQAHKKADGTISLFSRRLDNITLQFPDLINCLKQQVKGKQFIVEAEIIAIDEHGRHLPFQTLMQRRRKHSVEEFLQKIPIQAKMFDLLYYDGESYLHKPYEQRYEQLKKIVNPNLHITLSERIVEPNLDQLKEFFQKMIQQGYEGIMIKSMEGEYQAGTRGWNWIKWKKEYVKELSDTFDLVIIGAYYGKGKRAGGYGAFLCAAYNKKADRLETVCKFCTGLSDALLAELPRQLKKHQRDRKPARVEVSKEMQPDIWFEPAIVVEVLAAEITKSPFHSLGLALRFPRFIRLREDKTAEQATTTTEIKDMVQ